MNKTQGVFVLLCVCGGWVHMCLCDCVQRLEVDVGCLFDHCFLLLLRQGLLSPDPTNSH